MNRRTFIQSSAAVAALAPTVLAAAEKAAPTAKPAAAGKPRALKRASCFPR
jgi:anaerobic selenocysteine-containing dehydrogenase